MALPRASLQPALRPARADRLPVLPVRRAPRSGARGVWGSSAGGGALAGRRERPLRDPLIPHRVRLRPPAGRLHAAAGRAIRHSLRDRARSRVAAALALRRDVRLSAADRHLAAARAREVPPRAARVGRDDPQRVQGGGGGLVPQRRKLEQIIDRAVTWLTLVVIGVILFAAAAMVLERSIATSERKEQQAQLKLETLKFQVLNAETGFRGFGLSHQ